MAELSTLGAVVKTAYEGQTNTNAYTDAEKTKVAELNNTIATVAEVTTGVVTEARSISPATLPNVISAALGRITEITELALVTSPNATDLATALTLVNELKTKVNAIINALK